MKSPVSLIIVSIISMLILTVSISDRREMPAPTEINPHQEEGEMSNARKQWFESIHRAAPGTDWRSIDRQQMLQEFRNRGGADENRTQETFANGQLTGTWTERGSSNQAGSLIAVDYVPATDYIYSISAGGALWKGPASGASWTAIEPDLQFNDKILQVIPNNNGGNRILCAIGKQIWYSDDEGGNWNQSTGLNYYDEWGGAKQLAAFANNNDLYFLVQTWDNIPWASRMWLYRSSDKGATFTKIFDFGHGDYDRISMWHPYGYNELYIASQGSKLYQVSGSTVTLLSTNATLPTNVSYQIAGHKNATTTTVYVMTDSKKIYKSTNNGTTWTLQNTLSTGAWDVGIEVSLSNASRIYYGNTEAYRSTNSGASFTKVNTWGQYYSNPAIYLHADIMDIAFFRKANNAEFAIISNHGGLYVSNNFLVNNTNIGLNTLNVGQFYDVQTDRTDANYIYGGTQDQGHQRANNAVSNTGPIAFEQVISGDYGHMSFSNNNSRLWTVYPGGWVTYYHNPKTGGYNSSWDLTGTDKPNYGWITPTAEVPVAAENSIFIGGGNTSGGSGSYLIKLTAQTSSPYNITSSQYNYNFKTNSNSGSSLISAIAASKVNTSRYYVATDDGTFFYSTNGGTNWTKTANFNGPDYYWLYGSCILPSKLNANTVWFAGSGYSNPAVYKSVDGGVTFTSMSNGLPSTLVFEITANADETMLFAATEVGPYVYTSASNTWYPMRGNGVPLQSYYSVEYLAASNLVRFGTHGRGIWDFSIATAIPCQSPPVLSANTYGVGCAAGAGEVNLTVASGTAPYTYTWSNGASTQDILNVTAGNYTVTVTDAGSCSATGTYSVPNTTEVPPPHNLMVTMGCSPVSATLNWLGPNTGTYEIKYRIIGGTWLNVGNVGNVRTYTLNGLAANTSYQFAIRFKCGSGNKKSNYVPVNGTTGNCLSGGGESPEAITITGISDATEWTIYPNPAKDWFYLSSVGVEKDQTVNIEIYNLKGQRLSSQKLILNKDAPLKIEIENLSTGIYLVQLQTETGVEVKKLMAL